MKKVFLLTIYPFLALGQVISPTNPYTKSFVAPTSTPTGLVRQSAQHKAPTLSDIVQEFDAYWEGRDYTKKGSGYNSSANETNEKHFLHKWENEPSGLRVYH